MGTPEKKKVSFTTEYTFSTKIPHLRDAKKGKKSSKISFRGRIKGSTLHHQSSFGPTNQSHSVTPMMRNALSAM